MPDLPELDVARAQRAIAIFNRLRLADVPGQPRLAEAAGDWQREIVGALHGSIDRQTKERHIREVFLLVPKKNSKTSGGAALMLDSLLMNERPRAEFLLVAPTQAVSELAFQQVEGAIGADPALIARTHVQTHLKMVTYRPTGAKLRIKSFDPKVLTGVKPAGILVDELHVVAESPDADRVIGQLRGGLISQPEGFLVFITTQSERPPAGVFRAELAKARAIRDSRAAGAMLPILYEFPEDIAKPGENGESAPWHDPKHWWMVTPNRGRSITVERLVPDFEAAKLAGKEELIRWASQHLNIEVGLALRSDRWSGADFWEACAEPGLTLEDLLARSEVTVIGIDGGGLDDLLGLAVLGRERGTRRWLLWCHAWAHRCVLERRKEIASRLLDFEREGTLTIIDDGSAEDVEGVADVVEQVEASGAMPEERAIGVDPAGITDIVDELELRGFDADPETGRITGISQGWQLTNTIKTAERRLAARTLIHGGTPLMAWAVGNAKTEPRGNAVTITKQAAGKAKIDPLMATFNAVALMALNPSAAAVPAIFAV